MRVPSGVSATVFSTAMEQFERVVGRANVYTSDDDLDLYRDAYSIFWDEPEERIASGALAPSRVEEAQAIVRIANQHKIPLYPISTGRNLGYGGAAPNYSRSVVLDLKRMNKVLEIDEKLHYCIVEPGVSFFDLYAELRRRNLRLQASIPAPGWGSPIGNALDDGHGYPAGNNFRNSCGMEVVLPNGEVIRTGMGAVPSAKTWATYVNGVGPCLDGIFAQSNFGIVTKMGFNLFPWPDTIRGLSVATRNYQDLDAMIEVSNALEAAGVVRSGSGIGCPLAEAEAPEVIQLFSRHAGPTSQQLNRLANEKNVDVLQMGFSFEGPDKVTQAKLEYARDRFSAIPGIQLTTDDPVFAPQDSGKLSDEQAGAFGKPNLLDFWPDVAQSGWDGHFWFLPLVPRTGEELRRAQQVFGNACREMDSYWGWPPIMNCDGAFCIVKNYGASKTDPAQNKKTREVVRRLIQVAAEQGWIPYRIAPALQDAVMAGFSFNHHSLMRFKETLKDAIDPNGILSAGRYGIWPKHLRMARS